MPAPATVSEFLDLLRKSDLVTADRLEPVLREVPSATKAAKPEQLAQHLIRQGALTQFQARQLLQGRWRRFLIGGKYKLLELLGTGGMGAVYLCEHIFMRRLVALKVLPRDKLEDVAMRERFYREARAGAALNHQNIVRAYDIDQFEQMHFLVMEHVDGTSLQEIVDRFGPLAIPRAVDYMLQASAGLQHAHEAGMVHRDIKPGNLLLSRVGVIKILDMGLARFFDQQDDKITEKYDERTVLGTADYLSPEQGLQSKVDIRADLYSLGATFYFVLTGRTLFPQGSIAEKLLHHQHTEPTPIRELRPELSKGLAQILHTLLAKNPDLRYPTPASLMEALSRWASPNVPPPPENEMPRWSPAIQRAARQLNPGTGDTLKYSPGTQTQASGRPTRSLVKSEPSSRFASLCSALRRSRTWWWLLVFASLLALAIFGCLYLT